MPSGGPLGAGPIEPGLRMKRGQSKGNRRRQAPKEKGSSKCQGLWQDRGWHSHQLGGAVHWDPSEQTRKERRLGTAHEQLCRPWGGIET